MPKAIRYLFGYLLLWMLAGFAFTLIMWAMTGKVYAQTPNVGCSQKATFDTSTSGSIQLVAAVTGTSVRVCGFVFFAGGTTATKLISGTGMACGTGAADITPAFPLTINTSVSYPSPYFQGLAAPPGNALCVNVGSSAKVVGFVTYSQSP